MGVYFSIWGFVCIYIYTYYERAEFNVSDGIATPRSRGQTAVGMPGLAAGTGFLFVVICDLGIVNQSAIHL